MDKHRLELFSDGVFVIVLTLLVLDLKPPLHPEGFAGILEIAPGLLVHAATFLVIGLIWTGHHNMMARVHHVGQPTLLLNLLALFWVTLMPFGARMAAEHPLGSLGIGLFTACRGFYLLSFLALRRSARSHIDDYPELKRFIQRRTWLLVVLSVVLLISAALCWVSPWFGYAVLPAAGIGLLLRPAAELEQALLESRAGPDPEPASATP